MRGARRRTHTFLSPAAAAGRAAVARGYGEEMNVHRSRHGGRLRGKYPAARLEELLRGSCPWRPTDLFIGLDPADDAAVYRLDDDRAIVVHDRFLPADRRRFRPTTARSPRRTRQRRVRDGGQAAARALGRRASPRSCRTERCRQSSTAPTGRCGRQMRSSRAATRSGTPSPSTAGRRRPVHPDGIWPKAGARPGDALYLTKPLGTGARPRRCEARPGRHQRGSRSDADAEPDAASRAPGLEPNAVTDVTGFGLAGHAHELAEKERRCRVGSSRRELPALAGALEGRRRKSVSTAACAG